MRQKVETFEYEQYLSQEAAEIFKQMNELEQLRKVVRLAELAQAPVRDASSPPGQFGNHRSVCRISTARLASAAACRALTRFLTVDPDSEILDLPLDRAGVRSTA